jgi:hypothetical protein
VAQGTTALQLTLESSPPQAVVQLLGGGRGEPPKRFMAGMAIEHTVPPMRTLVFLIGDARYTLQVVVK